MAGAGKRIEVIVDNDGEVKIEAFGRRGQNCTKDTEPLTKALIGTPTTHVKKPEYYQGDHTEQVRELE